jgi:hypothetical protein
MCNGQRPLIFISYRRDDSAGYAGRLHESIERRLGPGSVFRDVDALEPGQDFVTAITARLGDCRVCLVLIGREWLGATDSSGRRRLDQPDDYVRLEIAAALARPEVRVIPVLLEGAAMPPPDRLPEPIRALSRRHALSLRDEAWDADVDRLVTTTRERRGAAFNARWAAIAGAALLAIVLARTFAPGDDEPQTSARNEGIASDATSPQSAYQAASAISLPPLAEIAHDDLIYSLLSGDVASGESGRRVRLRIRISNEGPYGANFWDSSFRLAMAGRALQPTSGLNEIVDGHSARQGVVTFDVPREGSGALLQVSSAYRTAELPIDLTPKNSDSQVDIEDAGEPRSGARVFQLITNPRTLVTGKEISYTLVSASARRFVNTLRIVVNLRMTNQGRYPALFGFDAARLLVAGQPTAPSRGPNEVVAADASATGEFVFDVPPATSRVGLRVAGGSSTELVVPAS